MEATESPKPSTEDILVNPADLAELEPLTDDELKALVDADESEEKPEENPSKAAIMNAGKAFAGGILGFLVAGYANNYVMQQVQKTATSALTPSQLLQYTAVLFVVELVVAVLVYCYAHKVGAGATLFVEGFAGGIAIAGFGAVFSQYLIHSGQSNPILPAVNFSGKPFVPANRVVST